MKWIPSFTLVGLFFLLQTVTGQNIEYTGQLLNKKGTTLVYAHNNAQWSFTSYDSGMIKITCLPKNDVSNQQLSNAVITSPVLASFISDNDQKQKVHLGRNMAITFHENTMNVNNGVHQLVQALHFIQRDGYKCFSFQLKEDEQIFGGGERAVSMNRRGHRFNLYNAPSYGYGMGADQLNFSLPFFISSNGYGIFFDNPSKGFADIGSIAKIELISKKINHLLKLKKTGILI